MLKKIARITKGWLRGATSPGPRDMLEIIEQAANRRRAKLLTDAEIALDIAQSAVERTSGFVVVKRHNGQRMYIWVDARHVHMCCSPPNALGTHDATTASCYDFGLKLDENAMFHIEYFLRNGQRTVQC